MRAGSSPSLSRRVTMMGFSELYCSGLVPGFASVSLYVKVSGTPNKPHRVVLRLEGLIERFGSGLRRNWSDLFSFVLFQCCHTSTRPFDCADIIYSVWRSDL